MSDKYFPYGAQYYRTPNPPQANWERDLREMKAQGMNTVRLWAMWSYIHRATREFDFSHLDQLLDICRQVGLRALIQVILENAPAWLVSEHPEARYVANDGQPIHPMGRPNTPGGGWPGLCLDNPPARSAARDFMTALASHFAGHEALLGYDVWNEVWFELDGYIGDQCYCYCPATTERFRTWLRGKYGELDAVEKAWYRRYSEWEQIVPPPYWGGYPDWLDWIKFRLENQGRLLRWRVATLREVDPNALLVSHGLPNTIGGMATMLTDDWRNAKEVDLYGLSCFPLWFNYDNDETFKVHDVIRGACGGKTFWTAETQAGASGEGLMHSRAPKPEDIRLWNWISLASGGKGVLYWQWRPELLGPESPGFGLCKLDGSPSERTEAASWFARFTNSHPELLESTPVCGEIAIAVCPESQLFCHVSDRNAGKYAQSVRGAYRAFSHAGYQVDFAKIDQIAGYPLVYLPFPLMIEKSTAKKLAAYVRKGGCLISEACPALFGDSGYVQVPTPGYGLDEVFGIRADEGPETIHQDAPRIRWDGRTLDCAVHRQRLIPTTARVLAEYSDGGPAVTENDFGSGRAVILGTYPGLCFEWGSADAASILADLATQLEVIPRAWSSDPDVRVRLHTYADGHVAFVVNLAEDARETAIRLPDASVTVRVEGRDAVLLRVTAASVEVIAPETGSAFGQLQKGTLT